MYELEITQKRPSRSDDNYIFDEKITLFFNNFDEMTITMQNIMKASRNEIYFEIRELEEGELEDEK